MKIIFVCLGNICRSPMAEFIMKELLNRARRADITVESRATGSWEHGNPVHSGTIKVLSAHAIPTDSRKVSQKISDADFLSADFILAMDEQNVKDLQKIAPAGTKQKIRLLNAQAVPDPWYTGDFDTTYELIQKGCQNLLNKI